MLAAKADPNAVAASGFHKGFTALIFMAKEGKE